MMKKKTNKRRGDNGYVLDVLIEVISYGGEAILYGVRAFVKWWN